MVKKIVIGVLGIIVIVIAGVLIYAATLPDNFRIERSAVIKTSPEKLFAVLNDFQRSGEWSPYEKIDATMKRSFGGPATGKGSVYNFEGNKDIGAGNLEIIESIPPSKVSLRLNMVKPFAVSNNIDYILEPQGDATKMTWVMHGQSPYIAKVMCMLFMNMDNVVGGNMEAGMANLKTLLEK